MSECRYTKDHEWVSLEGDIATCGITDYAQKALGDIVYVELPKTGRSLKTGDEAAVVESAKAASEVYAPLDGIVTEVNPALTSSPDLVNNSPKTDGWFFKMTPSHKNQFSDLMDESAYTAYIKEILG